MELLRSINGNIRQFPWWKGREQKDKLDIVVVLFPYVTRVAWEDVRLWLTRTCCWTCPTPTPVFTRTTSLRLPHLLINPFRSILYIICMCVLCAYLPAMQNSRNADAKFIWKPKHQIIIPLPSGINDRKDSNQQRSSDANRENMGKVKEYSLFQSTGTATFSLQNFAYRAKLRLLLQLVHLLLAVIIKIYLLLVALIGFVSL